MSSIVITNEPCRVSFLNKDKMPNEGFFVNAATIDKSYDDHSAMNPKKFERLFEGLIKEGHWGCLDHVAPTFRIEAPMFVRDQIIRASNSSFNVKSGRYSEFEALFYLPEVWYEDVKRSELGGEPTPLPEELQDVITLRERYQIENAYNNYLWKLSLGVRKEQAVRGLPPWLYTGWWMTLKLSDWLHFLNLRLDTHTQYETRMAATEIYNGLSETFPNIIKLWEKYGKGPINSYGCIQTP